MPTLLAPSVPCALCREPCPLAALDYVDAPAGSTPVCAACTAELHEHVACRRLDTDALEAEGTAVCRHCGEDSPLLALDADGVCVACWVDPWTLCLPANDNAHAAECR